MKQIYVSLKSDGTSTPNSKVLNFQSENLATRVNFTYPKEYEGYTKQIDIYVGKSRQTDYKVLGTTSEVYIDLNDEYLQAGYLSLQPIAYLGDVKVKFEIVKFDVKKSLDVIESTTSVPIPLAEELQEDITQLNLDMLDKMNLNGDNSNVDVITFNPNTLVALSQVGQLRWNNDLRTLELRLSNDVTLSLGNETLLRAMNKQGSTILNGKACYISGGAGANIRTKLATNTDGLIAQSTIGVATEDLLNNESGYICTEGIVNGINTLAFNEGDVLYLGTNGDLINVEPIAPTPKIFVGVCLRSHGSLGSIYVKVRAVPRLSRLSDVYINNLQNNDVLKWNSTTMRWENKPL